MPENNQILSVEGQLIGMPTAGPESFSQQQLDYLKRALGVDETVLYEKTWSAAGGNAVLSESANNFQQLRITFNIEASASAEFYCPVVTSIIDIEAMLACTTNRLFELTCVFSRSDSGGRYIVSRSAMMQNDGTTLTVLTVDQSLNFNTSISSMNNSACHIMKVVGIHRISGGN